MTPYSVQWLLRFKPAWFRHDLLTLLDLLKQGKIKPLIVQRLPLEAARARARDAGRRRSAWQDRAAAERLAEHGSQSPRVIQRTGMR